jgi:hypothetical protein
MDRNKFVDFDKEGLSKSVKRQFDFKKALFIITFLLIYVPILIVGASPLAKDKDFSILIGILAVGLPIGFFFAGRLMVWKR